MWALSVGTIKSKFATNFLIELQIIFLVISNSEKADILEQ